MEPSLIGGIGLVALLVMLTLSVHIGVALAVVGVAGTAFIVGFDRAMALMAGAFYSNADNYAMIVLPLFVFMGLLAAKGGMTQALYNGLSLWLGKFRAGLGIATVLGCAIFGTVCGSSLVTASVVAKVSAPEMRRHGYLKRLAYGIPASAGMIGMLIPPSIFIVIYAVLTEQSVGKLLIAGFSVGTLCTIMYSLGLMVMSKVNPAQFGPAPAERVSWGQRLGALRLFWPFALTGLIVIGGIFGGVFTPNEAGSIATLVVLAIIITTQGKKRWEQVGHGLFESICNTGMIFLILGGAVMFSRFLTLSGIATSAMNLILSWQLSQLGLVAALIALFLFAGMFMDVVSAMVITIPFFYPALKATGVDPIWFGMVATLALETGVITPPVGLNVFAVKAIAESDVSLLDVFFGSLPFFFINMAALIIIVLFPQVSTALPNLMTF